MERIDCLDKAGTPVEDPNKLAWQDAYAELVSWIPDRTVKSQLVIGAGLGVAAANNLHSESDDGLGMLERGLSCAVVGYVIGASAEVSATVPALFPLVVAGAMAAVSDEKMESVCQSLESAMHLGDSKAASRAITVISRSGLGEAVWRGVSGSFGFKNGQLAVHLEKRLARQVGRIP